MIRVAILAYACKTGAGSEPGAGFQWALAAAESASVEIITRPLDNQTRNELRLAGISVHELKVDHLQKFPQLSYIRWLFQAQKKLIEIHQSNGIQLVHHLTYATDWLPTPHLKNIPLVWGPVGGSTGLPRNLGQLFSRKLRAKETFRAAVTSTVRRFTLQWAAKNVSTLIAQNQDTAKAYSRLDRVYVRPNYIVSANRDFARSHAPNKNIAIVGRLIEMKGVHIAIAAMASQELQHWNLHVVGDGPMRGNLEERARELGVLERVIFHGQLARDEVYAHLKNSRCSLLLSTHDAAGWSAAESIAVGTPVHTWSHGGPAELVSRTGCGTTTTPGPGSIEALASSIAGTETYAEVDMSHFYIEAVALELRNWYDEATR